jgi:hypothetical protein
MRLGFNNTRYKDHPENQDPGDTWLFNESGAERVHPGPLGLDKDNYLYNDTNADKFNANKDVQQQFGQPKGIQPNLGPVNDFENKKKVFDDDLIKSFNNEDKLVDDILHES